MILGIAILLIVAGAVLHSGVLDKKPKAPKPAPTPITADDLLLEGLCASLQKDAGYCSSSRWDAARYTINTLISRYGIDNPMVVAQLRWSLENDDEIVGKYIAQKLQEAR